MTDLSPEARALLDAGREGLSPSAASKAKVLAAVQRSVASGSGGSSANGISGANLLLVLALATGIGAAVWLFLGDASDPQETRAEAPIAALAEPFEIAPAEPPAGANAKDSSAPDADLAMAQEIDEDTAGAESDEAALAEARIIEARIVEARRAEVRARGKLTAERAEAPPALDTLLDERKLIAAAQVAIRNKDYVKAHRVLHKHERLFPDGILAPERAAATAIALCLDPDESTGPAAAKRFLQANESSPLAQRVKRSCQLR